MDLNRQRHFTEEEARQTLVYVSAVVEDIVDKWHHVLASDRGSSLLMESGVNGCEHTSGDDTLIFQIKQHYAELAKVGCLLRDLNKGVILFPARNKKGYYMWRHGEALSRIHFYESTMVSGN